MTDNSDSARSPKAANDRAEARRLFAAAQERSAAAEYEEAMRLLKRIPKAHRGSDHERIVNQVRARFDEIEELTSNILAAMKKSKSPDILLPMVRRLVELKPGDEWGNDLRHRLESQEQDELSSRGRFGLGFGKSSRLEPQPLEESEKGHESDPKGGQSDEIEDWDEMDPIELIPVRPPSLPNRSRTNGEQPRRLGQSSVDVMVESRNDRRRPSTAKAPPPLPERNTESAGLSRMTKIVLLVLLFLLLAAISVVLGVVLAKGTDGMSSAQKKNPAGNLYADGAFFTSMTPQVSVRQLAVTTRQERQSLTKPGVVEDASRFETSRVLPNRTPLRQGERFRLAVLSARDLRCKTPAVPLGVRRS